MRSYPDKYASFYSIIIPVYNSENVVASTVKATMAAMESWGLAYEILLVNDGSPDDSWEVISRLAKKFPTLIAVNLNRNYGQHTAVLCGMVEASGDFMITMDDDLQNPPNELIKLIDKIHEGYDLVFARFASKKHASYRKMGSKLISYMNTKVFGKPKGLTLTNFRIFHKRVAAGATAHKTFYPYIPGLLLMNARIMGNVVTEHHPREIGGSNYSMKRIIKLVARLLFNYSSYPLRVMITLGFVVAGFSFLTGLFYFSKAIIMGSTVPGWSSMIVLLSFFNGILIGTLGVIGIYVSRIITELSATNSYSISEVVGETKKVQSSVM